MAERRPESRWIPKNPEKSWRIGKMDVDAKTEKWKWKKNSQSFSDPMPCDANDSLTTTSTTSATSPPQSLIVINRLPHYSADYYCNYFIGFLMITWPTCNEFVIGLIIIWPTFVCFLFLSINPKFFAYYQFIMALIIDSSFSRLVDTGSARCYHQL